MARRLKDKAKAYQDLVDRVRLSYQSEVNGLIWCEDCKEINLWTYWQGRGNLNAKIMLVGQDWGTPTNTDSVQLMETIRQINRGTTLCYMDGNSSVTDNQLIELFKILNYDISINTSQNQDLFFTNFVLGYRQGNISGGDKRAWFRKDAPFFAELVDIIEPKIILCLGRKTFEAVLKALGYSLMPKIRKYNSFIESTQNPIELSLNDSHHLYVFALAHSGVLGTMNRNRGLPKQKCMLEYQRRDWEKIKKYL